MSSVESIPKCKTCEIEMVEVVRIEPVGREMGMIVYECAQCKSTETIFFSRNDPYKPPE
jgi:hypothetical protein